MSKIRSSAVLIATATIGAVLTCTAPGATAAPGDPEPQHLLLLGESERGPWSPKWTGSWFGEITDLLTPGDVIQDRLYVFNNTGTKGRLTMTCVGRGGNAFAESLKFHFGNETASLDCTPEATDLGFDVPGRKSRQVTVSIEFPSTTPDGMDQTAFSEFTLTLTQIPPKGGKPQVLGAQTLAVGAEPAPTAGVAEGATKNFSTTDAPSNSSAHDDKTRPKTAKTTKVAAAPREDGGVTESLPLIGGLLIAGALLSGVRRRPPESD